jgi:hypothetical protein
LKGEPWVDKPIPRDKVGWIHREMMKTFVTRSGASPTSERLP